MKSALIILVILMVVVILGKRLVAQEPAEPGTGSIYDFTVTTIDGKEQSLAEYKGKTVMIVNTASRCGFTSQYKGLEEIYKRFKDQGFVILGFPANNFMGQEPGSNEEIKKFCELKFKTTFPMFAKISVAGNDIHPLYTYLTTASGFNGKISWNFNKFLINKDGKVVARFDSKDKPESDDVVSKILEVL